MAVEEGQGRQTTKEENIHFVNKVVSETAEMDTVTETSSSPKLPPINGKQSVSSQRERER